MRIALLGMYAGYCRDYNPGCFLIAYCTLRELRSRLTDVAFDVYARDFYGEYAGMRTETVRGMRIRHFPVGAQASMLDECIASYDAVVIGGDVVWGEGERENDIFFLESPRFLGARRPVVLYNSVHTFLDRHAVSWPRSVIQNLRARAIGARGWKERFRRVDHRARLWRCCVRAAYVSVRAPYVAELLQGIVGTKQAIHCVPDPVFALPVEEFPTATRDNGSSLPIIGVSARSWMVDSFLDAVDATPDLDGARVVIYPYSRQYNHLEFVLSVKTRCGTRFEYVDAYPDPFETVSLFRGFSASINDTFHGTVLALINRIPFAVFDAEPAGRSRKRQLLERVRQAHRCIYVDPAGGGHRSKVQAWLEAFRLARMKTGPAVDTEVRTLLNELKIHFDRMAETIVRCAG